MGKAAKTKEAEPALFDSGAGATADTVPAGVRRSARARTGGSIPPTAATGKAVSTSVVAQLPPTDLLTAVVRAAADPACQPEKMHALLDARDRLMAQEAKVQFMQAYIAMQDELPTIDAKGRIEIESKRVGGKKQSTPYATFHEINRITKPILKSHKFAMLLLPDVGRDGAGILMRGTLSYVCDTQYGRMVHSESCAISAPLETSGSKNNVQGVGSSLSYCKRYAVVALLNLVSEAPEDKDDDGVAAGGKPVTEAKLPQFVSAAQVEELKIAIEDCGVSEDTFLDKYQIDGLMALPFKLFDEALAACKRFKAARTAKK